MTEERARAWCPARWQQNAGAQQRWVQRSAKLSAGWGQTPGLEPPRSMAPHAGHRVCSHAGAATAKHHRLGGLVRRYSFLLNAQDRGVGRLVSSEARLPASSSVFPLHAPVSWCPFFWREDASPTGFRSTPHPRSDVIPFSMTLSAIQSHSETLGVRT